MAGIDPSISLGVTSGAPAPQNPLATLGALSDIQNKQNQNALFQQQFMAKQRAGEIIATGGGMDGLMKDPTVAPFAGQIINEYKQGMLATQQIQGEQQKQSLEGMNGVVKAMISGVADPSQLKPSVQAWLGTLSPSARARVEPAANTLVTAMTSGLPKDPAAALPVFKQRLIGNLMATGVGPDQLAALTGRQVTQDQGGALVSGVAAPAQLGGGFTPASSMAKTLSPQVVEAPTSTGSILKELIGGAYGQGAGGNPMTAPMATGNVLGQGPSQIQTSMNEARGKDLAQDQTANDSIVNSGARIVKALSEARPLLDKFKSGGGAETYARLANIADMFGASQKVKDMISNGDAGATQEFQKLMVNTTMDQANQQLPKGSVFTQREFEAFKSNNPNIETDTHAIEKVFNFWTKIYQQNADEQQTHIQYKQNGGDPDAWPAYWQNKQLEKGYVKPEMTNNAAKATHKWIPGQGLVAQ